MILVILAISVALVIVGCLLLNEYCDALEGIGAGLAVLGFIGGLIAIGVVVWLTVECVGMAHINDRIELYQEENTKIEEQIASVVEQYQEYETGIFKEVAPDKAVVLATLYPELKSDTLVQSQIELYTKNHEQILKLKETRIMASTYRWWLYFGR